MLVVGGRHSLALHCRVNLVDINILYSFGHKNEGDKFEKEMRFVFHES